jgi:hypothetical protein
MKKKVNTDKETQVQVHLAEYNRLQEEVIQSFSNMQQTTVLTLGSASIVLPVLLSQANNISLPVIIGLLSFMSIIYSALEMNISTSLYNISVISKYVSGYIAPEINRLIETEPEHKLLSWVDFNLSERKGVLAGYLTTIGPAGSMLLTLLPSTISIVAAQYLMYSSVWQVQLNTTLSAIELSLTRVVIMFSWIAYVAAVLSLIFVIVYQISPSKALKTHSIKKTDQPKSDSSKR